MEVNIKEVWAELGGFLQFPSYIIKSDLNLQPPAQLQNPDTEAKKQHQKALGSSQ